MKIDVADLISRLDSLEAGLHLADQVNGRLVREREVMERRLTAIEGTVVALKNEIQRADIIAQKAKFQVDLMKDMVERNYQLDVEAGIAKALAEQAVARSNAAATRSTP